MSEKSLNLREIIYSSCFIIKWNNKIQKYTWLFFVTWNDVGNNLIFCFDVAPEIINVVTWIPG